MAISVSQTATKLICDRVAVLQGSGLGCKGPECSELAFSSISAAVLLNDRSFFRLRTYCRARTVAAELESIHFRRVAVQNHLSNLFIWIQGSLSCKAT